MDRSAAIPAPLAAYLAPGRYIDSDHPAVVAFAARVAGGLPAREAAVKLYYAVRDEILYDPYRAFDEEATYRASAVLAEKRGYCVGKAALLAAAARAAGIPSRIGFADVRNHLATPRLRALIGTDVFIYHGITELWLGDRWVKATPTFNLGLCEKFHIRPLDFDGAADAILHPYDRNGRQHMEYVRQRGTYADVPLDILMPEMLSTYPALTALAKDARGDFAKEAQELG
ncbi:MAG TPA: transglutaminase-like domain-containing protein [Alphaproteobacteria bacterium]